MQVKECPTETTSDTNYNKLIERDTRKKLELTFLALADGFKVHLAVMNS